MSTLSTKKKGSEIESPFGFTHPERDIKTMCRCCYNEDTQYEGEEDGRKLYSCFCGARWNFKES